MQSAASHTHGDSVHIHCFPGNVSDSALKIDNTVKPVYTGHPWEIAKVIVIYRVTANTQVNLPVICRKYNATEKLGNCLVTIMYKAIMVQV